MNPQVVDFRSIQLSNGRGRNRGRSNKRFTSAAPKAIAAPQEAQGRPSPESWGIDAQSIALASNADVEARHDPGGRIGRAQRYDVFSLLFYRPGASLAPSSYDAVRRFQGDLAILHRTQGASDAIRATGKGVSGVVALITEDFSVARTMAGRRVDEVMAVMAEVWLDRTNALRVERGLPKLVFAPGREIPSLGPMIRDICETEVVIGKAPNWHAIVVRHTGERDRHAQGTLVRMGSDDMAEGYRRIDNEPKRASA